MLFFYLGQQKSPDSCACSFQERWKAKPTKTSSCLYVRPESLWAQPLPVCPGRTLLSVHTAALGLRGGAGWPPGPGVCCPPSLLMCVPWGLPTAGRAGLAAEFVHCGTVVAGWAAGAQGENEKEICLLTPALLAGPLLFWAPPQLHP